MKLIDNWRDAIKHYSTAALATLSGVGGAWVSIPDTFKASLPGWVAQAVSWIVVAVAMLGLAGKFISQTPKDDDDKEPKP